MKKYRILNVFNKNPKKLIIAIDNKNESSILKLFLILIFKRGNQMKKVNLYIESMPEDGITQAPDTISAEYDNGVLCFYYFNDDKTEVAETDTESGESELKEFKSLLSESKSKTIFETFIKLIEKYINYSNAILDKTEVHHDVLKYQFSAEYDESTDIIAISNTNGDSVVLSFDEDGNPVADVDSLFAEKIKNIFNAEYQFCDSPFDFCEKLNNY